MQTLVNLGILSEVVGSVAAHQQGCQPHMQQAQHAVVEAEDQLELISTHCGSHASHGTLRPTLCKNLNTKKFLNRGKMSKGPNQYRQKISI